MRSFSLNCFCQHSKSLSFSEVVGVSMEDTKVVNLKMFYATMVDVCVCVSMCNNKSSGCLMELSWDNFQSPRHLHKHQVKSFQWKEVDAIFCYFIYDITYIVHLIPCCERLLSFANDAMWLFLYRRKWDHLENCYLSHFMEVN